MENEKLNQGYIQVYTGDGKGKTTAAIGQAVRAAGYGLRTYIAQFMKEFPYSEINSLKLLNDFISIEQFCGDEFVYKKELPGANEVQKALKGLKRATENMLNGKYNIIILDEVCVSIYFKLFSTDDVVPILKQKPKDVELILTGRYCPEEIIEKADLVTEMKEIKHYYKNGITSRKGIES